MQRCQKCGRTYENDTQKFCTHDGGRLVVDDPPASSQAPTAYDLNLHNDAFDPEATVTRLPDLNKTVTTAPTSELRAKETGPAMPPSQSPYQQPGTPPPPAGSSTPTIAYNQPPPPQQQYQQHPPPPPPMQPQAPPPMQPQAPQQPYAPAQSHQAQPPQSAGSARKPNRMPLIIGLVVLLLVGGAAAWYFLIYKKGSAVSNSNSNVANANGNTSANANENSNAGTNANSSTNAEPPPPENAAQFVNSSANLDGKLVEKYSDFSFYYPKSWELDPKSGVAGASNFVRVERRLPPDFTQENFTVSWYDSQGTAEADESTVFPKLVESLKGRLAKAYPEFEALSEGETTVNGIRGHEFRFKSVSRGTEKGDITLWGRVVFLPPGKEGDTNGVQLLMLTTSLAPELEGADDIGVKGELPMILNSFKIGSSK